MPRCKLTSKMSEIFLMRSKAAGTESNKSTPKERLMRKIVSALDKEYSPDNSHFYAEDVISMENIKIEIEDVGELSFPLTDNCIKTIINISSKAYFGSGKKTLLDENVRNTHEIKSNKLNVSFNQKALDCMMNKLRSTLGLAENCTLVPHLHNMLVYSPGHFFDLHQDSEKLENMVGTLVIVLPNAHIGGDLVIEFGGKKHIFSSEGVKPVKSKCISFYADCKHKIEKVKDGHRIALTYNLVLKTEELILPSLLVNDQLCEAIRKYFELKEDEQKLVYFLNHSYTEHGLKWNLLKGEDRLNSIAFHSAAKKLGLIPHLALVKIKEVWSAEGFNEPDDFLDSESTMSFWIDTDNKMVPFSKLNISDNDICLTKETNSFEPYYKEYEGYTGNAGNEMDYWYRRAAIVLWPESIKYSMSFKLGYEDALEELSHLCKTSGNKEKVISIIQQAGKYLCKSHSEYNSYGYGPAGNSKNHILKLSDIALYIENSETALSLFSYSKWSDLSSDFAEKLANLQHKYDVQWCIGLLEQMKRNSCNASLDNIGLLIKSLVEYKVSNSVIKFVLDAQFDVIKNDLTRKTTFYNHDFKSDSSTRSKKLREFFKACMICEDHASIAKVIHILVSNTEEYSLASLTDLYTEIHDSIQPEERVHFEGLRSFLTKTIDHKIIAGVQSDDNWSINFQLSCKCENCVIATNFLQSKTEKTKVWPLREKLRNHVKRSLASFLLPLKITVERTGSPHKLVLVKTDELHKGASKKLKELKLCQEKLRALCD